MDSIYAIQSNSPLDAASSSFPFSSPAPDLHTSTVTTNSSCNTRDGVTFSLFFLGRVVVYRKMRNMSYEQFFTLTDECIVRVRRVLCGLDTNTDLCRSGDYFVTERDNELISKKVELAQTGTGMIVSITLDHLTLVVSSNGKTSIYDIGTVSFAMATGYAHCAFMLMHPVHGSVCLVFRSDRAEDARNFVATLSQAFDRRFKRYLSLKSPSQLQSASEEQTAQNSLNSNLYNEPWYHRSIYREMAEQLVVRDGDFLVWSAPTFPNEYVLTGKDAGRYHYKLLVVDEDGQVHCSLRKIFISVAHFVKYHQENKLLVEVNDSRIMLKNFIFRNN